MTYEIFDKPKQPDKKYGPNELDYPVLCPRCSEPVAVFIRRIVTDDCFKKSEVIEYHCRKCFFYRHKDGTLIKRFEPEVIEFRTPAWMTGGMDKSE
jgi:hypothetical protein